MTTISDTFTRANSTSTLGSTESPVLAWTADNGTWGINTNQAYVVTQAGFDSRATIPVGQANMDVSAAITTAQDAGVMASYVDSGNYYLAKIISSAVTVVRRQGGADTNMTTGAGTWTDGATLRLVTNDSGSGTQVTAYIGATQVYTTLDTTAGRPAGTRAGLRDGTGGSPGSPRFDNLSVVYTVPTGPVDTRPATNVRVEVAFTTAPDDPAPAWRDLTSRLDIAAGISITRGRQDEYGAVTPGRCSLTLDNTDGELTAGRSASSFYPNVKPSRRLRVTYRGRDSSGNWLAVGNLLTANQASVETSVADYTSTAGFGLTLATFAQSATRAQDGAKSLLVTWPTASSGNSVVYTPVSGLVIGRTYTFSLYAYAATGAPDVAAFVLFTTTGSAITTKNAFTRGSVTFTATNSIHYVGVITASASTSGQQVWIDAMMLDEGTATGTFTTTAPPIEYRYDGYVEEWPTEWPGGNKYTQAPITATDVLARLGTKGKLRSVVEETVMLSAPNLYYPLGEAEGSTMVGDVTGTNDNVLSVVPVGAGGGTLTFATGTGPGTDGIGAPQFAPASTTSGYVIAGSTPLLGGFSDLFLRVSAATIGTNNVTAVRLGDDYGSYFEIGFDTIGHVTATGWDNWVGVTRFSTASSVVVNDGGTENLALTLAQSGGLVTWRFYRAGTQLTFGSFSVPYLPLLTRIWIGGGRKDRLFTGTISHVAAGSTAITSTALGEQALSTTTGFAGERSDQRIARIASWAGIPTARQVLETGQTTSVAFVDTTGVKPLDAMQLIADTEQGVLFADTQGRLVFKNRTHAYSDETVVASVDAHDVSEDISPRMSKQDLVNDVSGKRTGGPDLRYRDAASVAEHGEYSESIEVAATSDLEVMSAMQWRVNSSAQPTTRVPNADVDAMTNTAIQAQVRALDVGSRLQVTSMPTQTSPASTLDLVVQGYQESISVTQWRVNANTTTKSVVGLRLDDAVFSRIDSTNQLIY